MGNKHHHHTHDGKKAEVEKGHPRDWVSGQMLTGEQQKDY